MMKWPAILLLAATTILTLHAEDMQLYLQETVQLVANGQNQDALERFIWFHEHALEHDPAMYGVRLSFALSYWRKLGGIYPPALKAMRNIRDQKTKQLENGHGDADLFNDIIALNRELALNEPQKTVALFEILDRKQPELAQKCWPRIRVEIINSGKFPLAGKYLRYPLQTLTELQEKHDENAAKFPQAGSHFRTWNDDKFVEEVLALMQFTEKTGQHDLTKKIKEAAILVVPDPRIK